MHKILFALGLLLTAAVWPLPGFAARETITIVADTWCPYNCASDDANPGYMVDIVREAFKKADIQVVYKVMPWKHAVEQTRAGKYDAIVGANHGDAPDFIFPETVQGISINQVWVKHGSDWSFQGLHSLDDLRIGLVAGYSYGKDIDPYFRKREQDDSGRVIVASASNAAEQNIHALLDGKVDAIIEDKNVINYYFATRRMPLMLRPAGNPVDLNNVDDTYIFVAFGPKNPNAKTYAELLSVRMQEMRQSGELKAILSRYNIDDSYRFLGAKSR